MPGTVNVGFHKLIPHLPSALTLRFPQKFIAVEEYMDNNDISCGIKFMNVIV